MKAGDIVLVDTNVIIEGHEKRCWSALTHSFKIETVNLCVVEAMTGNHTWNGHKPDERNNPANLGLNSAAIGDGISYSAR